VTVELGAGAHRTLAVDGRGRVVAVYRRAAYLRLPIGLVALTAPDVCRGPLHVRSPIHPGLLAPGDPVEVVAGTHLRIGAAGPGGAGPGGAGPGVAGPGVAGPGGAGPGPAGVGPAAVGPPAGGPGVVELDLSGSHVWRGRLPDAAALAAVPAGLAAGVFSAAPQSALLEPAFAGRLAVAHRRLLHDDLAGVADALGGLGPGLTPAGDDALAGLLLATRASGGPAAEARLVGVARSVRTTAVARAFLEWAARGQCVEPAHDLLVALAARDAAAAALHLRTLVGLGHTSGADLSYGIALGVGVRVVLVSSA
jgi:hypothetical protein